VGLQPTVFYRWQKEFFENGAAAFEQKRPINHSADQERIAYLQKKIQTKDEVLAELMAEHVALKKNIGAGPQFGPNDDDQRRAFCVRWIGWLGACSPRKLMKNKATHRGRVTEALPSEFAVGDDMFHPTGDAETIPQHTVAREESSRRRRSKEGQALHWGDVRSHAPRRVSLIQCARA
jgi:hypothetical protein